MKVITKENIWEVLSGFTMPWAQNYLAMYSSIWGGVTTDPHLMSIPADDHVVHRGDGVFDAMRCVKGKIYQMERHLERLERSARSISLELPVSVQELKDLIIEVTRAGGERDCIIRVTVSRGPGGFSTNPYECSGPQLYISVIRYKPVNPAHYEKGVRLITSKYPQKDPFFAKIKSCNYLLNVLMKKEAMDQGADYAVGVDEAGFLTEGSTENIGIVDHEGFIVFPPSERVLAGTTCLRVAELAEVAAEKGFIRGVIVRGIRQDEAYRAREVFLTGTSINVLPVTWYDGHIIGDGRPGNVVRIMLQMLLEDMEKNQQYLTEVF